MGGAETAQTSESHVDMAVDQEWRELADSVLSQPDEHTQLEASQVNVSDQYVHPHDDDRMRVSKKIAVVVCPVLRAAYEKDPELADQMYEQAQRPAQTNRPSAEESRARRKAERLRRAERITNEQSQSDVHTLKSSETHPKATDRLLEQVAAIPIINEVRSKTTDRETLITVAEKEAVIRQKSPDEIRSVESIPTKTTGSTIEVVMQHLRQLTSQQERQNSSLNNSLPALDIDPATHVPVVVEKMIQNAEISDKTPVTLLESRISRDAHESTGLELEHRNVHTAPEADDFRIDEQTEQLRQLNELFGLPAFGETVEDEDDIAATEVIVDEDEAEDTLTPYDLDRLHDAMDSLLTVGLAQEEVGLLDVSEQESAVSSLELFEFLPIESVEAEVSPIEADLLEPESLASERVYVLLSDLQVLLEPGEPFQEEAELSPAVDLGIDVAGVRTLDIVNEENLAMATIEYAEITELTPEIESKVVEILEAMGYQQPQVMLDRYVVEYGSQALLESLQQLFPVVNRMQYIADTEGFLEATSGQSTSQSSDDDNDAYESLRRLGRLICRVVTQSRVAGGIGQAV